MNLNKIFFILGILILFPLYIFAQSPDYSEKLIPKSELGVHNRNFKLNGYYYQKRMRINKNMDTIKSAHPIILFKNGAFFAFDGFTSGLIEKKYRRRKIKCTLQPKQDFPVIKEFISCYMQIARIDEVYSIYSVKGNLIRTQHFTRHGFIEQQGTIINDSTFVITKQINHTKKSVNNTQELFQFQSSVKPDSTKFKPVSEIKEYFD